MPESGNASGKHSSEYKKEHLQLGRGFAPRPVQVLAPSLSFGLGDSEGSVECGRDAVV